MQELIIDGHSFAIAFEGFAQPLRTRIESTGESLEVALPPWPCARHLDGLRRYLYLDGERLALDAAGYADEMLAWAEVPESLRERLRPLALWWALGRAPSSDNRMETAPHAGPDAGPAVVPDAEGWVTLGPALRARLRQWTWGERLAAQRAQLADTAGSLDFDAVTYLERMLAASVQRIEDAAGEAVALEMLDAGATRTLLAATTAINHPDRQAMEPLAELPATLAAATLRLCAALGWPPGRVLALPATEVDALLALLDAAEGYGAQGSSGRLSLRPPVPAPASVSAGRRAATMPTRPRVADHPDAVVILFGDDEDEL
ncbi:MAG TPA: hypothetical protein VNM90_10010 [Haliangium sp.]|nr:hypothetical protein [Haliangium sp.]